MLAIGEKKLGEKNWSLEEEEEEKSLNIFGILCLFISIRELLWLLIFFS